MMNAEHCPLCGDFTFLRCRKCFQCLGCCNCDDEDITNNEIDDEV